MNIEFTKSFLKDLKSIKDESLFNRVKLIILNLETAVSLTEVPNVKFIVNSNNYYRIRVGDYRIGIKLEKDTLKLIRCLHRNEIYRKFP